MTVGMWALAGAAAGLALSGCSFGPGGGAASATALGQGVEIVAHPVPQPSPPPAPRPFDPRASRDLMDALEKCGNRHGERDADYCTCLELAHLRDSPSYQAHCVSPAPAADASAGLLSDAESDLVDAHIEIERLRGELDAARERASAAGDARADLDGFRAGCAPAAAGRDAKGRAIRADYYGWPDAAARPHIVTCAREQWLLLGGVDDG